MKKELPVLNPEIIRQRCTDLLIQAEQQNDETKRRQLQEFERRLQEEDCFTNPRKRSEIHWFLFMRLGFTIEEVNAYYRYMEKLTEAPGVLFCRRSDGSEFPVEAILNPKIEDYFQFEDGVIFKIRNDMDFYYLASDGRWVYDGGLQRNFYDTQYGYESIRYQIAKK